MLHPWDSQQFRAGAKAAGRSKKTIETAIVIARNIKKANSDLPVVLTLHHVSHLSDVSAEFLQDVIFRKIEPYRTFHCKSGEGPMHPQGNFGQSPFRNRASCRRSAGLLNIS